MNTAAAAEGRLSVVPLLNAVFCVDCETISSSPHDACMVCGSHSLTSLFRMLGGTLRSQEPQSAKDDAKTPKYNLELTANIHAIPATELNHAIGLITRLAASGGDVKCLHINVEPVPETHAVLKAA